mgnify:CR=1 FL=1
METRQLADLMLAALYTAGAAVGLGLASIELVGFDLASTWSTVAGYGIEYHLIASAIGLLGAYALNTPSLNRLSDEKKYLAGFALAFLVATPILPDLISGLADQSVLLAMGVLGVQTGGYWAIAHDL